MRKAKKSSMNFASIAWSVLMLLFVMSLGPMVLYGQEEKFPSKPIQVMIPFAPGGFLDVCVRIFGDALSMELKTPVIIQNQAGGSGLVGAHSFLSTKADGYTLFASEAGASIASVQLAKRQPFDPRKVFLPLGYVGDASVGLISVPKNSPFQTFDDFFNFAKGNPGKLKAGVSNITGVTGFALSGLIHDTKINAKVIPYPATGPLVAAVMGGHLDSMTLSLPATLPYIQSGDVRLLLLTRASSEFPGVPASPQRGFQNASQTMWVAFFVLPNTPKPLYDRLCTAIQRVSMNPEVAKKLTDRGLTVNYKSPADFTKFFENEWEVYARIIKETGITAE